MRNNEILKIIKQDIKEIKQKGYEYKIIEGLSINGNFEVDVMIYIKEGLSGFYKSYRTIRFKNKGARSNFLKMCEGLK